MLGNPRHDTRSVDVEVVSTLSHKEGESIVHTQHEEHKW